MTVAAQTPGGFFFSLMSREADTHTEKAAFGTGTVGQKPEGDPRCDTTDHNQRRGPMAADAAR